MFINHAPIEVMNLVVVAASAEQIGAASINEIFRNQLLELSGHREPLYCLILPFRHQQGFLLRLFLTI